MEAAAPKPYPSDVSDEEWALVAPCSTLLREDAGQRGHRLRELFNGLRYLVRTGTGIPVEVHAPRPALLEGGLRLGHALAAGGAL